jgi:hypothetical protein
MDKKDPVISLVKSMNKSEKRFFTQFSSLQREEKNYMSLFAAIDRLKNPDLQKVKKQFAGQKLERNFAFEKNYLQKQLYRSLRAFYSSTTSFIELQDILKTIEILYKKRHNAQCQKLLDKGIAICEKHEAWNYHLELIDWQYRIYSRTRNYDELYVFREKGFVIKKMLSAHILHYASIQSDMYFVLASIQTNGLSASAAEKKRLRKIITHYTKAATGPKSFRSSELMYGLLYFATHYTHNPDAALKWTMLTYKLYQSQPHFINEQPYKFFATTGNLINRCIISKKYSQALVYINELDSRLMGLTAFSTEDVRDELQYMMFNWQTRILLATQNNSEALKIAKEYERNSHKFARKSAEHYDNLQLARIYFANRLHTKTLYYANLVINAPVKDITLDHVLFAHLLRVCVHYEKNNSDTVAYLCAVIKRFLAKHEIEDKFVEAFIVMLKELLNQQNTQPQKIVAKHYPVLKKAIKKSMVHYEDLLQWLNVMQ